MVTENKTPVRRLETTWVVRNLGRMGLTLTFLWLLCMVALGFLSVPTFLCLRLNEMGDFLAGVFSPVAFLWLIIGFYLQRHELEQNSVALQLQINEQGKANNESQKQTELSNRALMVALKRMEQDIEPNFQLISEIYLRRVVHDKTYFDYAINIINNGADTTNVKVDMMYENGDPISRGQIEIQVWEVRKSNQVNLRADELKNKNQIIKISYLNKSSQEKTQLFFIPSGQLGQSEDIRLEANRAYKLRCLKVQDDDDEAYRVSKV